MTFHLLVLLPQLLALLALGGIVLLRHYRARRALRLERPAPAKWPVYAMAVLATVVTPATVALLWPAVRVCWRGCDWDGRLERLTRNGDIVSADLHAMGVLRRPPIVAAADLPPAVIVAFVEAEDRGFPDRRLGIDLRGALRSLVHDAVRRPGRALAGKQSPLNGASTIEMQTVRLLPGDPFRLADRTLRNKLVEMLLALDLRLNLRPDQILTLYLNNLPGPDGSVGIQALAERAFRCRAQDLSLAMAVTLAGANRSPVRLNPRVSPLDALGERTRVLQGIALRRPDLRDAVSQAEDAPVGLRCRSVARPAGDPWLMYALRDRIAQPDTMRTVRTTVDAGLQAAAQQALDSLVVAVERGRYGPFTGIPNDPLQGAMVLLRDDGSVAAAVCGRRDRLVYRAYDRCTQGRFECGSVCKAFSFAAGVELGLFDENTATESLREGPGTFCDTSQWGSGLKRLDAPLLSDVLRLSDNYGGCLMYRQLPAPALARIRALGVPVREDRPANAIGGGVYPSLLDLTAAFGTLGTGVYVPPQYLAGALARQHPSRVWSAATLASMQRVLEPVGRDGTAAVSVARLLQDRDTLLSKTGTSSESESLVYCAFLQETRMTGCLWLGRDRTRRRLVPGMHAGDVAGTLAGVLLDDARRRRADDAGPARASFAAATSPGEDGP